MYDAAIVGGGPAGCSAAIALAGSGARVVLFEAKTYPHDKLCGEFLSPECAGMLAALGLASALAALKPVAIETARVTAPGGAEWATRLPGTAWGLSRRAFDASLAARAIQVGVEVRQATTVTGIEGDLQSGLSVETRNRTGRGLTRARAVIAAHGKREALDRALDRRFLERPQPFVALKAHFHGPPLPGRIELHGFQGGYCGMSEIEGGVANVCLLAHESVFRRAGAGPERLPAFLKWMATQNEHLAGWLAKAEPIDRRWISIGQVPFAAKRPVVGHVLMAGDAAGLIAPLAGDGIAMALRGGQLSAARAADFLAGRTAPADLRRQYARDWRREFGGRLRLARALQAVALRPRWLAAALRALSAFPPLGSYLVTHTREAKQFT